MTATITINRATVEQALEFLDAEFGWSPGEAPRIDAMRAALAQQAEPVEPRWEGDDNITSPWNACMHKNYCVALKEERERRLARQAEPVEPVAWMYTGIKQDGTEHGPHLVWKPEYMDAMSASKGAKAKPLYTAPPQRKPLTVTKLLPRKLPEDNDE